MAPKIIIIAGPTASGKTDVAVEVALAVGGEVIGADSMQVYRGLDIGAATPTIEQMRGVPHHLIGIVEPTEHFTTWDWITLAGKAIGDITARGKIPIVAGGAGLYIRSLLHGMFDAPESDPESRKRIVEKYIARSANHFTGEGATDKQKLVRAPPAETHGQTSLSVAPQVECKIFDAPISKGEDLYEVLKRIDPEAASRIHPNDAYRIARAIEIFERTGKPISGQWREWGAPERYDALKITLDIPRLQLHERINLRAENMIKAGLVDEARSLKSRGISRDLRPMRHFAYRHIYAYIDGEMTLDDALSLMQRDTRRYARRQLTWFRAEKGMMWINPLVDLERIIAAAREYSSR